MRRPHYDALITKLNDLAFGGVAGMLDVHELLERVLREAREAYTFDLEETARNNEQRAAELKAMGIHSELAAQFTEAARQLRMVAARHEAKS